MSDENVRDVKYIKRSRVNKALKQRRAGLRCQMQRVATLPTDIIVASFNE